MLYTATQILTAVNSMVSYSCLCDKEVYVRVC